MKISGQTVKGIIFDVDGTLLDTVEIWVTASSRYVRSQGLVPEPGLDESLFSMSMEEAAVYLSSHYVPEKEPRRIVEEVNQMLVRYYREEAPLRNGAAELLRWLQQQEMPVAAATATDEPLVEGAFGRLGIRPFFQAVFTCSQVGAGKKKPRIYQRAAACLGTEPGETLVVEDALFALQTAKAAGFLTAGVAERYSAPEQEEIRSLADLYGQDPADLLKKLRETEREERRG